MHRGALRDFAMEITYVRIYERRRMRRGRTAFRSETRKEEAARDAVPASRAEWEKTAEKTAE
jgi:hypothetical protein